MPHTKKHTQGKSIFIEEKIIFLKRSHNFLKTWTTRKNILLYWYENYIDDKQKSCKVSNYTKKKHI